MNKMIKSQTSCSHLGNIVGNNQCEKRVNAAVADFNSKTNVLLSTFRNVNYDVKFKLFRTISMALYGSQLWDMSSKYVERFYVAWRKAIRRIFSLPYRTHCRFLHLITRELPIDVQLHLRTLNMFKSFATSNNTIVKLCSNLAMNGSGSPIANSINFIAFKYHISKEIVVNVLKPTNVRALLTGACTESVEDRQIASFVREVLASDRSFLCQDELSTILTYLCCN